MEIQARIDRSGETPRLFLMSSYPLVFLVQWDETYPDVDQLIENLFTLEDFQDDELLKEVLVHQNAPFKIDIGFLSGREGPTMRLYITYGEDTYSCAGEIISKYQQDMAGKYIILKSILTQLLQRIKSN